MNVGHLNIAFQPDTHSRIQVVLCDEPDEETPVNIKFDGLRLWLSRAHAKTLRNLLYEIDLTEPKSQTKSLLAKR
jgi:hypothetical protein